MEEPTPIPLKTSLFTSQSNLAGAVQFIQDQLTPVLKSSQQNKLTSYKLSTTIQISTKQASDTIMDSSKKDNSDTSKLLFYPFEISHPFTTLVPAFRIPNVFAPIVKDSIMAKKSGTIFLEEAESYIIIQDKYPSAPVHYLVIPKKEYPTILEMKVADLATLYVHAIKAAITTLTVKTIKLVINVNPPNQEVPHVHLHIMSNDK